MKVQIFPDPPFFIMKNIDKFVVQTLSILVGGMFLVGSVIAFLLVLLQFMALVAEVIR